MESSENCIETKSTPTSLPLKDHVTKETSGQWVILFCELILIFLCFADGFEIEKNWCLSSERSLFV